ncbi:KIF-binding protein-like [Saccostrea echinata]|uniref:KIF-binding protein-like n=1 Tax=Saccostrea echinata TaxID=191078 RepID=UPI002A841A25|nr:KIF-binding protein-like [Saccostrea echinata]
MAAEWRHLLEEEGYEKFKEAIRLSEDESKNDPDEDPFRSKYKAREIFLEVKEKLKPYLEKFPEEQELLFLNSVIDLRLGINYIDTEELQSGEEYLTQVIDATENYKLHKNASDIYLHALNNLGILWFGRRNPEKSLSYLLKAEELYFKYKAEVDGAPKFVAEYLKPDNEDKERLEHLRNSNFENSYTHTLYYMAQVYAKLDESEKSALCCHKTLQRQLDAHTYTPLDWAINAATLSQYFVTKDEYAQARHCLACAEVIYEETKLREDENLDEEEKEKLQQGKADIQRCWAKYGLALLEFSRDRLLKATDEEGEEQDQDQAEKEFEKFNLEVASREEQITCKPVRDFEEARNVFLCVQTWLNGAKEFYVFDGRCTDYVEIVQDHSKAFKLLAFFELNLDRQCKMHKRRIDMLLEVCNELNPQHYLLVVRQLTYELAEIYSNMLDIKYMILKEEGGQPSVHAMKKINSLAFQSIEKYKAYIDSFRENGADLPVEFPELDTRPVLVAWFCMGRLYSKIFPSNVRERLDYIKKTENCYQYVIDYCKQHPKAAECMRTELEVCEEMVQLLPLKMEKIRQEAEV